MNRPQEYSFDLPTTLVERQASPHRRVRFLLCALLAPLLIVGWRLFDVTRQQSSLVPGDKVAIAWRDESIPAGNGRILSSDGRVLAEDLQRFELLIHYRWLEQPANSNWLRGEALRRLTTHDRRDRTAVLAAETRVLEDRERLWSRVTDTAGIGRTELVQRFAAIQGRVEEIRRRVLVSRSKVLASTGESAESPDESVYQSLVKALTTPPARAVSEPLILREELTYHSVANALSLQQAANVEITPEDFPGTRVRLRRERVYPLNTSGSNLIGYRFADRSNESDDSLTLAQTGLERSFDRVLRGQPGVRRLKLDRRGEVIGSETLVEPNMGHDIVLHLDSRLQSAFERLLDLSLQESTEDSATHAGSQPVGGALLAIDARTGAILAAATAPRFDLNAASQRDTQFWSSVQHDPAHPLLDRIRQMAIPPGSVFKLVTAIAALESGEFDPDEPFDCLGYLQTPDRHRDFIFRHSGIGHGPLTLDRAIAESCNVYFFRLGEQLGGTALSVWGSRLGFGRPTGVDLPHENAGQIHTDLRPIDPLGLAVGQADLLATPLQVARLTCWVANGQQLVTPHLVRGLEFNVRDSETARPVLRPEQVQLSWSLGPARLREGMNRAVSHPAGTAYNSVRHHLVSVAGKTGTAETGDGQADHAWFAGYLPAQDPQIVVVAVLEHGGSGGHAAGQLAHEAVSQILRLNLLR